MKAFWIFPLVAVAIGCSPQQTDQFQNDAQNLAKQTGQAATSLTIAGKVDTVLRSMKWIDNSDIHVDAKEGVVTISGSAEDESQKGQILHMAEQIKGVDKVVDHMVLAKP